MFRSITHKLTAYILVVIVLAHNINTLIIVGDFLANQEFIAKTLCIQKDDQQGCNGKCHLKTQLAKNESGTNGEAPIPYSKRTRLDVFFVSSINSIPMQTEMFRLGKTEIFYSMPIPNEALLLVDTPPPNRL